MLNRFNFSELEAIFILKNYACILAFGAVWFVVVELAWGISHHFTLSATVPSSLATYRVELSSYFAKITPVICRFAVPAVYLMNRVVTLTFISFPFFSFG